MSINSSQQQRIELLKKYDVPCPRYTSYPTVPYWDTNPTTGQWIDSLNQAFSQESVPYGIYIHIPFCETLCTYCGCNNSITKNHDKEMPYVEMLLKEWDMYLNSVPKLQSSPLKQIHLGGGTPTFLSAESLEKLLRPIIDKVNINDEDFEGAIEIDPRTTKPGQLEILRELGFQRISLGVQDFDPTVQKMVRRIQPFEMTKKITDHARSLGFEAVNFDLIYGLPGQTLASIEETAKHTIELMPDRIALYSLAIVPWIKPAQRTFKDEDLPQGPEKRALYDRARELFLEAGYVEIGMDHFALKSDALYTSFHDKSLHRNFMGYTDQRTDVLIGLGVSSISESPTCFHQNEKMLPAYERHVANGELPTYRGHLLSKDDMYYRQQILQFMTQFNVELKDQQQLQDVRTFLASMLDDQLVEIEANHLKLTDKDRPFLRNACMALDQRLRAGNPEEKVFSRSI
jgi:oxygen-independent coproporphyrinogen-3 oxidase